MAIRMLSPEEALAATRNARGRDVGRHWVFPPARVLVVDDGEENRELVQLVLGDVGPRMVEAPRTAGSASRRRTRRALRRDPDGHADAGDGRLHRHAALRKAGVTTPIVALTANAMKGFERECLEAGCTGYPHEAHRDRRFARDVAGLLGGERRPGPRPGSAAPVDEAAKPITQAGVRLVSRLASDPRFQTTIEKFARRLGEKLVAIEASFQTRDFAQLADFGHWLKGSAGMVGFDAFSAPAAALERHAKRSDVEAVRTSIDELKALARRISLDGRADAESGRSNAASADASTAPPRATTAADGPVVSRLASNVKLRPTLAKFALRLEAKLEEMEQAFETRDFARLGEIAHWLKGAAGTVGFEAFTAPAEALELLAREGKEADIEASIRELRGLAERMEIPSA